MRYIKLFESFSTRYFDDIKDLNSLHKRYRKLVMDNHPDRAAGDEAEVAKRVKIMQDINLQKEQAEKRIRLNPNSEEPASEPKTEPKTDTDYEPSSSTNKSDSNKEQQNRPKDSNRKQQKKRPKESKVKLTPEQKLALRKKAEEEYKATIKKAKEQLEKSNRKAKEELDSEIKENPKAYTSSKILYDDTLRRAQQKYQNSVAQANKKFKIDTQNL